MILRTWHGRTRLADAEAYEEFMRVRAAPDYATIPGLWQTLFSRRDEGDVSHFLLIMVWDDMDAVGAFAGKDPAKAKYYPEDDEFLLEKEDASLNHTILFKS